MFKNATRKILGFDKYEDISAKDNERMWRASEGALAIRRIFSLVDMITKPKFSNCPNIFKIGLFR